MLVSWLVLPVVAEDRLPRPRIRVAEREFGGPMSDYSKKWDAFDYLTVAGVALFLGTRVHGDRGLRRPPKWRYFNQV